jgi:hypothetical protein
LLDRDGAGTLRDGMRLAAHVIDDLQHRMHEVSLYRLKAAGDVAPPGNASAGPDRSSVQAAAGARLLAR